MGVKNRTADREPERAAAGPPPRQSMIKLTFTKAEKEAHKKILEAIKKKIDRQTVEVVSEIRKKTIIYALWSLGGILLIVISFPKPIFFIFSFVMTLFAGYFFWQFLLSLKTILKFIDNFNQEITNLVEKEIKAIKEDSLKNKVGLMLSGLSHKNIEDLSISYFMRELVHRLKKHKQAILLRIAAYTIAVLLFKEILFNILR